MRSREIVRRTIDYDNPSRVARSFGESDLCFASRAAKTHATDNASIGLDPKWQEYACDEFMSYGVCSR